MALVRPQGFGESLRGYETRAQRIEALRRALAEFGSRGGGAPAPGVGGRSRLTGGVSGVEGLGLGAETGGGVPGAVSPSGPVGGITGFDAATAAFGLSALGMFGMPAATAVGTGLSAAQAAGVAPETSLSITTPTGQEPVEVSGRLPSLLGLFGVLGPAVSFNTGTADVPAGMAGAIGSSVAGLSHGVGVEAGAAAGHGPQGGHNANDPAAPHGLLEDPGQIGTLSIGVTSPVGPPAAPTSPVADPTQNEAVNADDSGASGSSGDGTVLCTLLRDRGLVDRETLRANARYRAGMTAEEYAGYVAWAGPLVRLCRRRPAAFRVLYATLGWLVLAYMREIRAPGSSRLGRALLTLGLPVCGWLGNPRRWFGDQTLAERRATDDHQQQLRELAVDVVPMIRARA